MEFSPVILAHVFAAVSALITGAIALALKKGTPAHRLLGRAWVMLMLLAALLSFGIKTSGHFSWIHLLSLATLFAVGSSVYAAAKGRIAQHKRGMSYTYIGLVTAGIFTLAPSRLLGHLLWSSLGLV